MHRLDRRLRILRGKRQGAFNPNQYYLEPSLRSRTGRAVRAQLRQIRPVTMVTPRWSCAEHFLGDVRVDLAVGEPPVTCHVASMESLMGRPLHEQWASVMELAIQSCGARREGPLSQAVDRRGFRYALNALFTQVGEGRRQAMLFHGIEHLHIDVRHDLVASYEDYRKRFVDYQGVNLLLAGSVEGRGFSITGSPTLALHDYGASEGIEALVEHVGLAERRDLGEAFKYTGGVPALVHAIGKAAEETGTLPHTREDLRRALRSLSDEIHGVISIIQAESGMADRLEQLVNSGRQIYEEAKDQPLIVSGLLRSVHDKGRTMVELRAPAFADIAGLH